MELQPPDMEKGLEVPDPLIQPVSSAVRLPSYYTTRWPLVNRTLAIVDNLSGGRAGWVQRFFSFAFFGGCAALTNLLVFFIVLYKIPISFVNPSAHYVIAFIVANEISIFANFIPNDYFTFSHLEGQGSRPWGVRCARYHLTSLSGSLLTFLIASPLALFVHLNAIVAQAIAIFIVLFYNFFIHHLFTYRHKKATGDETNTAKTVESIDTVDTVLRA